MGLRIDACGSGWNGDTLAILAMRVVLSVVGVALSFVSPGVLDPPSASHISTVSREDSRVDESSRFIAASSESVLGVRANGLGPSLGVPSAISMEAMTPWKFPTPISAMRACCAARFFSSARGYRSRISFSSGALWRLIKASSLVSSSLEASVPVFPSTDSANVARRLALAFPAGLLRRRHCGVDISLTLTVSIVAFLFCQAKGSTTSSMSKSALRGVRDGVCG